MWIVTLSAVAVRESSWPQDVADARAVWCPKNRPWTKFVLFVKVPFISILWRDVCEPLAVAYSCIDDAIVKWWRVYEGVVTADTTTRSTLGRSSWRPMRKCLMENSRMEKSAIIPLSYPQVRPQVFISLLSEKSWINTEKRTGTWTRISRGPRFGMIYPTTSTPRYGVDIIRCCMNLWVDLHITLHTCMDAWCYQWLRRLIIGLSFIACSCTTHPLRFLVGSIHCDSDSILWEMKDAWTLRFNFLVWCHILEVHPCTLRTYCGPDFFHFFRAAQTKSSWVPLALQRHWTSIWDAWLIDVILVFVELSNQSRDMVSLLWSVERFRERPYARDWTFVHPR